MELISVKSMGFFKAIHVTSGDNKELRRVGRVLASKKTPTNVRKPTPESSYDHQKKATHFAYLALDIKLLGHSKLPPKTQTNLAFQSWLTNNLAAAMPEHANVSFDRQMTSRLILAQTPGETYFEVNARNWLAANAGCSKLFLGVVLIYDFS